MFGLLEEALPLHHESIRSGTEVEGIPNDGS